MATVEDFILRLKVDGQEKIKQVSGAVQGLSNDVAAFGASGGAFGNTLDSIVGKLGPLGAAAGAVGAAFVALGFKAIQLADQISDIAAATGISESALLSFKQSVVDAGGSIDDYATFATKLNQSLNEAAAGNEKFQDAFRNLGVYVRDSNGQIRNTETVLNEIISKFQDGEITSKEYTAAIDLLGKTFAKIDPTKLKAVNDPFKDAEIKQLAKYQEAIDNVGMAIERSLITMFGKLAIKIDEALTKAQEAQAKMEAEANKQGRTYGKSFERLPMAPMAAGVLGKGPVGTRPMTPEEKFAAGQPSNYAAGKIGGLPAPAAATTPTAKPGGDYGAVSPDKIKAQENALKESQKRIAMSRAEIERATEAEISAERLSAVLQFASVKEAIELKGAARIKDIQLQAEADISKAREEIFSKENLTKAQKVAEFSAKEAEINAKASEQIAQARSRVNEELKRESDRLNEIILRSKELVKEQQGLADVEKAKFEFLRQNSDATARELKNAQDLFELEQERLRVIAQIAKIKDLSPEERLAREQEINDVFAERKRRTVDQQQADYALTQNFSAGWSKALNQYREDAFNKFQAAGQLFQTVTRGMEDAIIGFAKTGKFEWKDFANSILEELVRIEIRKTMAGLFSGPSGGNTSVLGGVGKFFSGFFADGGRIPAGGWGIAGEAGPEIITGPATVTPMDKLSSGGGTTVVNYNISAVDAKSFQQLVASDPEFIYAVTLKGQRGMPGGR